MHYVPMRIPGGIAERFEMKFKIRINSGVILILIFDIFFTCSSGFELTAGVGEVWKIIRFGHIVSGFWKFGKLFGLAILFPVWPFEKVSNQTT